MYFHSKTPHIHPTVLTVKGVVFALFLLLFASWGQQWADVNGRALAVSTGF